MYAKADPRYVYMHFRLTALQVTVGGSAGLVYTPSSINAAIGDMVVFTFMEKNHTLTQSTFPLPCVKMQGGIDSGFMPNINNTVNPPPTFQIQVLNEGPYCTSRRPAIHPLRGGGADALTAIQGSTADRQATAAREWSSASTPPQPRPRQSSRPWPLRRTAPGRMLIPLPESPRREPSKQPRRPGHTHRPRP
jgi:hypothetical protein